MVGEYYARLRNTQDDTFREKVVVTQVFTVAQEKRRRGFRTSCWVWGALWMLLKALNPRVPCRLRALRLIYAIQNADSTA